MAAHSVLAVIEEEGLEQNVKERGDQLEAGLRELYEKYELVGDVRGEGLMRALEVVETREGKVPAQERAITVGKVLREEGVICVRGGVTRNVFRMNPPMCIKKDEITQLLSAMDKALRVASS